VLDPFLASEAAASEAAFDALFLSVLDPFLASEAAASEAAFDALFLSVLDPFLASEASEAASLAFMASAFLRRFSLTFFQLDIARMGME
jgi:hypothetical protein